MGGSIASHQGSGEGIDDAGAANRIPNTSSARAASASRLQPEYSIAGAPDAQTWQKRDTDRRCSAGFRAGSGTVIESAPDCASESGNYCGVGTGAGRSKGGPR